MSKMVTGLLLCLTVAISHGQTLDIENIKFIDTKKPVKCADTKTLLMGLDKIFGEKILRVAPNDLAIEGKPTQIAFLENVKVCMLMLEILKDYEYGLMNLIFETPPAE